MKIDGMTLYVGRYDDYGSGTSARYVIKASSKREAERKLRKQENIIRLTSDERLEVCPMEFLTDVLQL